MLLLELRRYYCAALCLFFLFSSCKSDSFTSTNVYPAIANTNNHALYLAKIKDQLAVKIACEGTSLTYGQNVPGPSPPINGASQTRAMYQYPEILRQTLLAKGINADVINRGFPGDRTTEGLIRWRDSTFADVCIIEYGTNDAFNFGGYPSGKLTVEAFSDSLNKIVLRRIEQKAWVIITLPPDVYPPDNAIENYRQAILGIADKYGLLVFDVEKSVISSKNDYFDGVHLKAAAYQKWGINIAPILYSGY